MDILQEPAFRKEGDKVSDFISAPVPKRPNLGQHLHLRIGLNAILGSRSSNPISHRSSIIADSPIPSINNVVCIMPAAGHELELGFREHIWRPCRAGSLFDRFHLAYAGISQ